MSANKKAIALYHRSSALNKLQDTCDLASLAETDPTARKLLQARYRYLDTHYEEFQTFRDAAIAHLSPEELALAEEISSKGDEAYFTAISIYERLFPKPTPRPSSVASNNSGETAPPLIRSTAKLPKLTLPSFDRNLKNWQTFRDRFNSSIHNHDAILNVEKFEYLTGCLSGEPLGLVSTLPLTNDNYTIAYDLLSKRYNNKRALATEHWSSIVNAPAKKKAFEKEYTKTELPSYDDLAEFVSDYAIALSRVKKSSSKVLPPGNLKSNNSGQRFVKAHAVTHSISCQLCKEAHYLNQCPVFISLSPNERHQNVRELRLCNNCLKSHLVKNCPSKFTCRKCNQKHHTLLHFERAAETKALTTNVVNGSLQAVDPNAENSAITVLANRTNMVHTLLATAVIKVLDVNGKLQSCRCLLDSASQSNFIRESFVRKLGLKTTPFNIAVQGISEGALNITKSIFVNAQSHYMDFKCDLNCLVSPKITGSLPSSSFNHSILKIPSDIVLADPEFCVSDEIDMLIGATHFWSIILSNKITLGKNQPILVEIKLGWIVSGPFQIPSASRVLSYKVETQINQTLTDDILVRFWQIEEPSTPKSILSIEEIECEKHFEQTYYRDQQGRFVVKIPFNKQINQLGSTREIALRRFFQLENKFTRNLEIHRQYCEFMSEYESLNHMAAVEFENASSSVGNFIAHHAVIRSESLSTKLRVVFDGSTQTSSGISFNKTQLKGPLLQSDLISILLRFRQHEIVFIGDIKMMYRQIRINPEHRKYQRIFWRPNPSDILKIFELNTLTYGNTSSTYIATKCLEKLSEEYAQTYPLSSLLVKEDFYMDDLITGGSSVSEVIRIRNEICTILSSAGFDLRKFMTNEKQVLDGVSEDNDLKIINFGENEHCKTLGVTWNSCSDIIQYTIGNFESSRLKPTKRNVLPIISSIFDPLGLVSPVIITAKILIQELWAAKISWDDKIPEELVGKWIALRNSLSSLNWVKILRHVLANNHISLEVHGFCDASEKAFGACIYFRSVDSFNNIVVSLVCAKAKVAPLKRVTLPRLELCGAVLLSQLTQEVISSMRNLEINGFTFWCDSTIALSWIRSAPNRWKTFVANRVAAIQESTNVGDWRHVSSENNPADLASRGVSPVDLINSSIWWQGPQFLAESSVNYVSEEQSTQDSPLPEARNSSSCCLLQTNIPRSEVFERFSSYKKLVRVTAWILRWKEKAVLKMKLPGAQMIKELESSRKILIKLAQKQTFTSEVHALKTHGCIHKSSKLRELNPFLDEDGILRVGGRLENAALTFNEKHQVLLSDKHILTKLIVREEHERLLHCGPQALLYAIREKYWPINGRNITRKITKDCMTCFRVNPH